MRLSAATGRRVHGSVWVSRFQPDSIGGKGAATRQRTPGSRRAFPPASRAAVGASARRPAPDSAFDSNPTNRPLLSASRPPAIPDSSSPSTCAAALDQRKTVEDCRDNAHFRPGGTACIADQRFRTPPSAGRRGRRTASRHPSRLPVRRRPEPLPRPAPRPARALRSRSAGETRKDEERPSGRSPLWGFAPVWRGGSLARPQVHCFQHITSWLPGLPLGPLCPEPLLSRPVRGFRNPNRLRINGLRPRPG